MGVVFQRGQQLGRKDLNFFLTNASGHPTNAYEIYYAIYDFTTGSEVLVGDPQRNPQNPEVGEYFAPICIPTDANIGSFRIRWYFRQAVGKPLHSIVQEFEVAGFSQPLLTLPSLTPLGNDLVRRLRILLRDSWPDKHARFRPPTHEDTLNQFNRVFGYLWDDYELVEFLERSLDMIGASPPRTPFRTFEDLVQQYPEWRTLLLTGAMQYALMAMMIHWVGEQFSVAGDTEVTLILPGDLETSLSIAQIYDLCKKGVDPSHPVSKSFLEGSLRVRSVTTDGRVVWGSVSNVLCHHLPHKYRVAITTASGARIVSSLDHSFFSHPAVPIAGADIQVGQDLCFVGEEICTYDTVTSVCLLPPSNEPLYDLSVPHFENFVLTNGILAHNSYSIGGVSLDINKASEYASAKENAEQQFTEQLERAKQTVKIFKGLQQPRYGIGIRSSFGSSGGRNVLTPAKFIGL